MKKWALFFCLGVITTAVWVTNAVQTDYVRINCQRAIIRGTIDVPASYVRLTVSLASDLSQTLAEEIIILDGDTFETTLAYDLQPDGTRLILAVGEWDGEAYIQPATLSSYVCGNINPTEETLFAPYPTYTPSPAPPTPIPTQSYLSPNQSMMATQNYVETYIPPTMTLVPVTYPDRIHYANITFQSNSCTSFATFTFNQEVTLFFSSSGGLIGARREDRIYPIQAGFYPNQYVGRIEFREAVYTLQLYFNEYDGFYAHEEIAWNSGCIEYFDWMG